MFAMGELASFDKSILVEELIEGKKGRSAYNKRFSKTRLLFFISI